MKQFITIAILFISINVFGQQFDGVNISGDLPTAISKYKAKGYIFQKFIDNGAILKGKIAQTPIELFIFVTPKSKKVYKVVGYLDEDISWVSLKSTYNRFHEIIINKYGSPDGDYEDFITPYYEGDGYELSAVGQEKVNYSAYWLNRAGLNVGIEISKFKQVKISYENTELIKIKREEQSQIESNSF
jgi:hypothetical protein